MSKLKLGPIADEKPIKVQVELPAALHQDLSDVDDIRLHLQPRPIRFTGIMSSMLFVILVGIGTERADISRMKQI